MGTVDRECGGAQPRNEALAAGTVRPWHALTASLPVVICCFVWLCLRQCHALILKTRAERTERERARAVGEIKLARERRRIAAASQAGASFLAMMRHEIRTPMSAVLGLAA